MEVGGLLRAQGAPLQGQGKGPGGGSRGNPLSFQRGSFSLSLGPKGWSKPEASGLAAWVQGPWNPSCLSPPPPEGKVSLQRQEELETVCAKLQRQVGEMEVRERQAQGCLPPDPGSEPASLGSPQHTPHTGPLPASSVSS